MKFDARSDATALPSFSIEKLERGYVQRNCNDATGRCIKMMRWLVRATSNLPHGKTEQTVKNNAAWGIRYILNATTSLACPNSGGLQNQYTVSNPFCAVRNCTVSLVNPEVYMGKEGTVYTTQKTKKPKREKEQSILEQVRDRQGITSIEVKKSIFEREAGTE